jgi:AcrR family transcriptional regulator
MNRRLEQGRRSKEEILDAASRIMSQRGFEGTSIAAISRETGLPNSSIYWHFDSKAAILAAVMERGASRFFEQVGTGDDVGGEPVDRLRAALHGAADALDVHAEFLRLLILLLLSNDEPEVAPVVHRVRAQGRAQLRLTIENSYRPLGDRLAARIADELADFALATFDGVFLASQFDDAVVIRRGLDQMATGIDAVAVQIAAEPTRRARRTTRTSRRREPA